MTIRRHHIFAGAILCGVSALISPRIEAQSFDCKKAGSVVEKAICNDQSVAEMDVELAQEYRQALSNNHAAQSELISGQRQWLAFRAKQCEPYVSDFGKMDDCLRDIYGRRIAQLMAGDFSGPDNRAASAKRRLCDLILGRYRPLARSHPGQLPLVVVASSANSGITITAEQLGVLTDLPAQLISWAASQKPPITISDALIKSLDGFDNGNGSTFQKAPKEDFYSLTNSYGNAGFVQGTYFMVRDGVALPTPDPDPLATYGGEFAVVDGAPIYVVEQNSEPEMSASVRVYTWQTDQFVPACKVDLTYAPSYSDSSSDKSCRLNDCDQLRQAAPQLAKSAAKDATALKGSLLAHLTAAQRTRYTADERIASSDFDYEVQNGSLSLPYVADGELYLASLGNFTVGCCNTLPDMSVKFKQLQDSKLIVKASFSVSVKGEALKDASVSELTSCPGTEEMIVGKRYCKQEGKEIPEE